MRRWWTGAALLLLVGCKGKDEGAAAQLAAEAPGTAAATTQPAAPAQGTTQPVEQPPREAAVKVELKQLLSEYESNEVRADSTFKGKLIQTSGTVGEVKKDITGGIYVTVGTGAPVEVPVLQCSIAESEAGAAAELSKGQKVTVRGRADGLMMNVLASGCEINPMMKLCKGLKAAIGAKECRTSRETGDAHGLVLSDDPKASAFAMIACNTPAHYEKAMATFSQEPGKVVVGSKRTGCFAVFSQLENGKPSTNAIGDDVKDKAKAFFDAI
ncbi:MAG TPA: hypothetical protein VL242_50125 [Sorangium sp.]|nr:hypothetical protein [Sorangium sp.]